MTDRARHWQPLVVEWKKSGLSQAAFCRRRTMRTWVWRSRRIGFSAVLLFLAVRYVTSAMG